MPEYRGLPEPLGKLLGLMGLSEEERGQRGGGTRPPLPQSELDKGKGWRPPSPSFSPPPPSPFSFLV